MQNENTLADARHDHDRREAEARAAHADAPTECGLTREELRALVVEMIG